MSFSATFSGTSPLSDRTVSNSSMVRTLQKLTTQPILKWRIAKQAFNKMTNIYLKALEHRAASSYVVRLEAALGPPWTNSSNDACKIYELLKRLFLCPGKDKRLKKILFQTSQQKNKFKTKQTFHLNCSSFIRAHKFCYISPTEDCKWPGWSKMAEVSRDWCSLNRVQRDLAVSQL